MEIGKKEFDKIIAEATKEFDSEKKERVKEYIKGLLREYEMAKATVTKIEKQLERVRKQGLTEIEERTTFLLE